MAKAELEYFHVAPMGAGRVAARLRARRKAFESPQVQVFAMIGR
jgi:hypothetical protein